MDKEINYHVTWFKKYKKTNGIDSPYLIVHPLEADRKLGGKPITAILLYRYVKKAMKAAGLTVYTLRDLRSKALTDEAQNTGAATNKGAHKTIQMRQYYVKKDIPVKVKSTLKRIGKD